MPAIVDLVSTISGNFEAKWAAAGYPALTDSHILLGRQHLYESSSPPRVVFVPIAAKFATKDPAVRAQVATYPDDQLRLIAQQRAIATEIIQFEVHCWGISASSTDAAHLGYDVTQAIYHCLIQTLHDIAEGCYVVSTGRWTTGTQAATQLDLAGQEFVFVVEIATPVLDVLLPYAPDDVGPGATGVTLKNAAGTTLNHVDVTTAAPVPPPSP